MSERIKREAVAWELAAAITCFMSAALSLVIGFVLTTSWLLNAQLHPLLYSLGLGLLIAGIPIVILAGHFMDLRERKIKHGHGREAVVSR